MAKEQNTVYLSEQMARYDNGKRIFEMNAKLNSASIYNAYKIHAGTDELYPDSTVKMKSVIGVKLISYEVKPVTTVESNISVEDVEWIMRWVNSGNYGTALSQQRVHGFKKNEQGLSPVQSLTIKREEKDTNGADYLLPWYIGIENGWAKAKETGVGFDRKTFVSEGRIYIRLGERDFFNFMHNVQRTIRVWEISTAFKLFKARDNAEKAAAIAKAQCG